MIRETFNQEIVKLLPQRLRGYFNQITDDKLKKLQEIRLRVDRPLNLVFSSGDYFLGERGLSSEPEDGEIMSPADLKQAILFLSNHSVYALEEELRQGFITIPGGHRVGLVGHGIIKNGKLDKIKDFSALNFRVTREIRGVADTVIPQIVRSNNDIYNTMIVSPPRCGKTTLLRDLIRQLSNGFSGFTGKKIGVVDERSEIAGSYQGRYRHDLGVRTDVLDHCPKSKGMYLLIRSMSPQIIATDELGSPDDVAAIEEAVRAGVRLITTVHGQDLAELQERPILKNLLTSKIFNRYIILSHRRGAGTIEGIFNQNLVNLFKPGPVFER